MNDVPCASGPLWLVMELAHFGHLRNYLRSRRPSQEDPFAAVPVPTKCDTVIMTTEKLLRYALQIAKGMRYLVSKEVSTARQTHQLNNMIVDSLQCLHCHLCAQSVLVCENDTLKLSNFGIIKEEDYHAHYNNVAVLISLKVCDSHYPVNLLSRHCLL